MFNTDTIIVPNFLDNTSANNLLNFCDNSITWDTSMRSRKTASFGKSYDYNQMSYGDTKIPSYFDNIISNIAKCLGWTPNNLLLNHYVDGTSKMGFHSDRTDILAPNTGVAILSIGSTRDLTFRNIILVDKSDILTIPLPNGTLFYMSANLQNFYTHAILPTDNVGARISLTFRQIV
jgi:alkylated DNA repair dioxygenase AlkB